jgi:lysophospholipase L1-like esterase
MGLGEQSIRLRRSHGRVLPTRRRRHRSSLLFATVVLLGSAGFQTSPASNDYTWTSVPVPNESGNNLTITDLSCPSPTFCMAVGITSAGDPDFHSFARRWDGTSWSSVSMPVFPDQGAYQGPVVTGVDCTSSADCFAVGWVYATTEHRDQTLVEHWDGNTWTVVPSPNNPVGSDTHLVGVSCASPTFCVAVGDTYTGRGFASVIERWDGTSWTLDSIYSKSDVPNVVNTLLSYVSCTSRTFCVALGYFVEQTFSSISNQLLLRHWDGRQWTDYPIEGNSPLGIDCFSATSCMVLSVQIYSSRSDATYWNGTTWTRIDTPNYEYAANSNLYDSVSCPGVEECVAGTSSVAADGSQATSHWDGQAWSGLESLQPPGGGQQYRFVDCPAANFCMSFGSNGSILFAAVLAPLVGNSPPAWLEPTPIDGSRFDVVPGDRVEFELRASDPDNQDVTITARFLTPGGAPQPPPSFVSCNNVSNPAKTAVVRCSVESLSDGSLKIMEIDARDSFGASAGTRRYLVSISPLRYVALGDSYSAGEGVDPYFRDGFNSNAGTQDGQTDNRCHRSSTAYAEQVTLPNRQFPIYELASGGPGDGGADNKFGSEDNVRRTGGSAWVFWACAGAITDNVLPAAQGGTAQFNEQEGFREQFTQLDNPSINFGTDLVTISIGGNDVGFAKALQDCAFSVGECDTPEYRAETEAKIDALKPRLVQVYQAIKAKTFNARVLALDYPLLFPLHEDDQNCAKLIPWRGEQDFFRDMGRRLGRRVAEAAQQAGVEFASVIPQFEGHEVCGPRGEWMNGLGFTAIPHTYDFLVEDVKKIVRVDDESFHPNALGQREGYAARINEYLQANPAGLS